MLTVTGPDVAFQDAFFRMLTDYDRNDPTTGEYYAPARADFLAYVESLRNEENGIDLREGMVPCSHRWLLHESHDIVGIVRVRHNIGTEYLAIEAGHIGYDVPPSFRGQGFGLAALKAGLQRARELGIQRVLVCADTDNPASWRTIERCGGVLEAELMSKHYGSLYRRYWIETAL